MKKKKVSGLLLTLLLVSMLALVFNVQPVEASGTIYIRADGSVDPSTAPILTVDNVTYTLTNNITGDVPEWASAIIVERDNIVIDGAGHSIQGRIGTHGIGIHLDGRKNVTIKNMEIKGNYWGIHLHSSSENLILGNNVTNNYYGINLEDSSHNSITENSMKENIYGVRLFEFSNYSSISGNDLKDNSYGIWFEWSSDNSIVRNNVTDNHEGIHFRGSSNSSIAENDIIDNGLGVLLSISSNNSVARNNVTNNRWVSVALEYSLNISVTENNVVNTYDGHGIHLSNSSGNNILGNNITDNWYGVSLSLSSNNNFYHNNFINNTHQVYDWVWEDYHLSPSINVWDNDYPSSGNYWSDYEERYPDAKEWDDSGIWDTPYVIDENNQDNYPLKSPTWSPKTPAEVPFWTQWWFWIIVTAGIAVSVGAVYFLKKRKPPTPAVPPLPSEGTDTTEYAREG